MEAGQGDLEGFRRPEIAIMRVVFASVLGKGAELERVGYSSLIVRFLIEHWNKSLSERIAHIVVK